MSQAPSIRSFVAQLYHIWITKRPGQFAAALAYYAIFSFVPVIYIALSIAGIFIDELQAADGIYDRLARALSVEAAQALEDAVNSLAQRTTSGTTLTTVIAFIALFFTASLLFFQLQHILNTIWQVPPPQRDGTRAYVRNRLLAFVMVIGVGLLLVAAAIFNLLAVTISSWIDLGISFPLSSVGSVILLGILFLAFVYKVLPNAEIAWRDVWVGSIVTAVLLALGGLLLGLYLGASNFSSALEAAGTVAVFLMAFYFVGQLVVFGAVFTRVYASMYGSKILPRTDEESPEGSSPGQSGVA